MDKLMTMTVLFNSQIIMVKKRKKIKKSKKTKKTKNPRKKESPMKNILKI